jgi:nitrite reductase/ring-hydroxylating ferredoxin subunit
MDIRDDGNNGDVASCEGCTLLDRRGFLRNAGVIAAGTLIALGASPARAAAAPIELISAISGSGEEKRYAIPAKDGAQIDKDAEVILVRYQGKVYAFGLACPHQNTALRWYEKDNRFECPKHHSTYRPDGAFIEGRATRGMDRFPIRQDESSVVVNLDRLYEEGQDEGWNTAWIAV